MWLGLGKKSELRVQEVRSVVGMEVGDGMVMLRLKVGIWSGLERRLDGMGLGMRGGLGREVGLDVGLVMVIFGLELEVGMSLGLERLGTVLSGA